MTTPNNQPSDKKTKRDELRETRLEVEEKAKSSDKRSNLLKSVAICVGIVVCVLAVVIGISSLGSSEKKQSSTEIQQLLKGIPENGTTLGNPQAPVTLVEYGDLRCPVCAMFSKGVLTELIEQEVKSGNVKIDFRNWVILGDDSNLVARASFAAREQGKYWPFIKEFYANQPPESEAISEAFLEEIARKAGVEDIEAWKVSTNDTQKWQKEIEATYEEAISLGFDGTPAFALISEGNEGKLESSDLNSQSSVEEFQKEIQAAAE